MAAELSVFYRLCFISVYFDTADGIIYDSFMLVWRQHYPSRTFDEKIGQFDLEILFGGSGEFSVRYNIYFSPIRR